MRTQTLKGFKKTANMGVSDGGGGGKNKAGVGAGKGLIVEDLDWRKGRKKPSGKGKSEHLYRKKTKTHLSDQEKKGETRNWHCSDPTSTP